MSRSHNLPCAALDWAHATLVWASPFSFASIPCQTIMGLARLSHSWARRLLVIEYLQTTDI